MQGRRAPDIREYRATEDTAACRPVRPGDTRLILNRVLSGQSVSTCSRAAPVPTSVTGTPSASSTNDTYERAASGSSSSMCSPQPRSASNTGWQWWKSLWCAGKSSVSEPSGRPIAHADGKLGELGEDVDLRQRERGDAVHADCEAKRDEIEPPTPPLTPRHRAELVPERLHALVVRTDDLARERALADTRDVRLCDAQHLVDPLRPDPEAHRGAGRDRARRRDERVRAVIEIEQRALGAFEEDALAGSRSARSTSSDVSATYGASRSAKPSCVDDDVLDVERLEVVHALQPDVLLRDRELELLPEDLRVEQVLHADPDARRLVRVRRADAAPRRTDLEPSEPSLSRPVERDVPGHDEMGVAGDEQRVPSSRARVTRARRVRRSGRPGRRRSQRRSRSASRAMTPVGICRILYVSSPTTTVWPAFGPPW